MSHLISCFTTLVIVVGLAVPARAVIFHDLGITGQALDVSADGSTVVGRDGNAFLWTLQDGVVDLGVLPGWGSSQALGVSADGSVVVGSSSDSNPINRVDAIRWTAAEGMVIVGADPDGDKADVAYATSNDGNVIVGRCDRPFNQPCGAFRWTAATGTVPLGNPMGDLIEGLESRDVSADGSIVVGFALATTGHQAFRWTSPSGMVGLGVLPGTSNSRALGISGDGSTIVGYSSSGTQPDPSARAFRWTSQTGMVEIGNGKRAVTWRVRRREHHCRATE